LTLSQKQKYFLTFRLLLVNKHFQITHSSLNGHCASIKWWILTFENGSKIRHRKMTKSFNLKVGVVCEQKSNKFFFQNTTTYCFEKVCLVARAFTFSDIQSIIYEGGVCWRRNKNLSFYFIQTFFCFFFLFYSNFLLLFLSILLKLSFEFSFHFIQTFFCFFFPFYSNFLLLFLSIIFKVSFAFSFYFIQTFFCFYVLFYPNFLFLFISILFRAFFDFFFLLYSTFFSILFSFFVSTVHCHIYFHFQRNFFLFSRLTVFFCFNFYFVVLF